MITPETTNGVVIIVFVLFVFFLFMASPPTFIFDSYGSVSKIIALIPLPGNHGFYCFVAGEERRFERMV